MSFGARFGVLVKTKRGIEGLTQQALAAKAFGEENRKSSISDLEKGKIPNPQQGTVDALVIALEIQPEELEACRHPVTPELPEALKEELGLADGLLADLAWRFGHDDPDAGRGPLKEFLRDKAREYRALKKRMDSLAAEEVRISNQLAAAQEALDAGDFAKADEILSGAEEIQQSDHTLVQVRKQAEIREMRAEATLFGGDADNTYDHFVTAAAFFDPFDPLEGASRRHDYFVKLYEHGERFGSSGLARAVQLLEKNLTIYTREAMPADWAATQNNLAVVLSVMGQRLGGEDSTAALERAVAAYEKALEVRTREAMPADWAMTQNNLANVLRVMGERLGGEDSTAALERAVAAYEKALEVRKS